MRLIACALPPRASSATPQTNSMLHHSCVEMRCSHSPRHHLVSRALPSPRAARLRTILHVAATAFVQSHPSPAQTHPPASMRCWHHASKHNCDRAMRAHNHAVHADNQETSGLPRSREICVDAPHHRAVNSCRDDPSKPPHPMPPDSPLICHRQHHREPAAAWWPTAHSADVCHASALPRDMWLHQSAPARDDSMFGVIAGAAARTRLR
jgi:hypothetical protein